MARKKDRKLAEPKENPYGLPVKRLDGEDIEAATARIVLTPSVGAAAVTGAYRPYGLEPIPLGDLIRALEVQGQQVLTGDQGRSEQMLTAQAHSLDAIFNRLAVWAGGHIGRDANLTERYLRLALKAQSQCRTTLETLANIKNPPIVYARQANISQGHQQVNNHSGAGPQAHAPEKNSQIPQNELLEAGGG